MDANKTEAAIGQISKVVGGVRKIIVFEGQAAIKPKSSAYSHRSSQDEDKIVYDQCKLKPFSPVIRRFHSSFDPLDNLNKEMFSEWLKMTSKLTLHCISQQLMIFLKLNLRGIHCNILGNFLVCSIEPS